MTKNSEVKMLMSPQSINQVDALIEKIESHEARVGVIGMGYVGLPLAVEKAKAGFRVVGFDLDGHRVEMINRGENYIRDVDDQELMDIVQRQQFEATCDMDRLADMDVVIIAVPTPLNKNLNPNLRHVVEVAEEVSRRLHPGQLVSLESTTYPGTTDEVLKPVLEKGGLQVGRDFFLAYSPERVDPGNSRFNTRNTQKLVGASDPNSLKIAMAFYGQAIDRVLAVSSASAAEFAKVFENTFRSVNIALVNEVAMLCDRMGLDVWEILDAAFTKPFGIMPFYPGPGVGGHCIPLDPHYLEWKAREFNFNTHFISLAGEVNRRMPDFVVQKALRILNDKGVSMKGANIFILGVAYKKNIDDPRESPAAEVLHLLAQRNAVIAYHDPFVPRFTELGHDFQCVPLDEKRLQEADLVLILTDHTSVDYDLVVRSAKLILDTRNVTKIVPGDKHNVVLL